MLPRHGVCSLHSLTVRSVFTWVLLGRCCFLWPSVMQTSVKRQSFNTVALNLTNLNRQTSPHWIQVMPRMQTWWLFIPWCSSSTTIRRVCCATLWSNRVEHGLRLRGVVVNMNGLLHILRWKEKVSASTGHVWFADRKSQCSHLVSTRQTLGDRLGGAEAAARTS